MKTIPHGEFLFAPGQTGFKKCHASTLLSLGDGEYLCAWFAGSNESSTDTAIWLSRRQKSWSTPAIVGKVDAQAHWNPVLFAANDLIYLFFKVGRSPSKWQTYWMRSHDKGYSWDAPSELVSGDIGGRGPVKNKPIQLQNGDWLAPASLENDQWFIDREQFVQAGDKPIQLPGQIEDSQWTCFVDRSCDDGVTWQRSDRCSPPEISPDLGVIQPTLWESSMGMVHMLMRSTHGKIYRADSQDNGYSWSEMYAIQLPNNNSGIDLVRFDDGRLVLAYNPVEKNWGPRTPLNLAISTDNGEQWEDIYVLEERPGEYSYPAVIATSSGCAVSYTYNREQIKFCLVNC